MNTIPLSYKSLPAQVILGLLILFYCLTSSAESATRAPGEIVPELYHAWEQIQYATPKAKQEARFLELKEKAEDRLKQYPDDPDLLIWTGIITSTYAGAAGGLTALSAVKDARAAFEHALEIDPTAFQGSAYTSLGSLYAQVPGWPLSFGDDAKAEELLKKGLEVNPTGIDANYFYADYLVRQERWPEAREYLERARRAPPRPDRPLADGGRLQDIIRLQKTIDRNEPSLRKP